MFVSQAHGSYFILNCLRYSNFNTCTCTGRTVQVQINFEGNTKIHIHCHCMKQYLLQ